MKKRILSVLMAFALALTLLPAEAIASGSSQGDEPITLTKIDQELITDWIDFGPAVTSADLDLRPGYFAYPEAAGNAEKWIDRRAVDSVARNFYEMLEKGSMPANAEKGTTGLLINDQNYEIKTGAADIIDVSGSTLTSATRDLIDKAEVGDVVTLKTKVTIKNTGNSETQKIVTYSCVCVMTSNTGISKDTQDGIITAFYAFDRDHPEAFWLDGGIRLASAGYSSSDGTAKNCLFVVLKSDDGFDLRDSDYRNAAAITSGITEIGRAHV